LLAYFLVFVIVERNRTYEREREGGKGREREREKRREAGGRVERPVTKDGSILRSDSCAARPAVMSSRNPVERARVSVSRLLENIEIVNEYTPVMKILQCSSGIWEKERQNGEESARERQTWSHSRM